MKTFLSLLLAIALAQIASAGTVSGVVLYQGDSTRPINNVVVTLTNIDNTVFASYTTGPNGYYEFLNVPSGTYTIRGIKTLPGGGVTMKDAILVHLHILGHYPFDEIQSLAADVDGSGNIDMEDYNLIKDHVLRNTPFPIGEWVFLSETVTVNNLKDSHPGGISGSSSGDVGGVFVPGTRTGGTYPIANTDAIKVSSNEPFSVSIKTTNPISLCGTSLIINYPSDIVTVTSVDFPVANFQYVIDGNQVRLVWDNENGSLLNLKSGFELVTLHCVANANFTQGMTANFTLDGNTSLVSNTFSEITDAGLQIPAVEYTGPSLRLSNYPNPFGASTTLSYYLPVKGDVTIDLFDQSGRLIKQLKQGVLTEGYHSFVLESSGLTPGSYTCKLSLSGNGTQTIRLLKSN